MNEKSKMLTIGQFASLHGINKKTLMWYDEIGCLRLHLSARKTGTGIIIITRARCWKPSCCCGNSMCR